MIQLRRSSERGHFDHGWLNTYHTFSFDRYYDPDWVRFSRLRVLNEDYIAPGMEFPDHPHRDMEIITYVLEGALEHGDSMGNGSIIQAGDIQYMCAGTGVVHHERNAGKTGPTHLVQIWILPDRPGYTPSYAQQTISDASKRGRWCPLVSPDGRDGSIAIHQDALLYTARFTPGEQLAYSPATGRVCWLQVLEGAVTIGDITGGQGDGLGIQDESELLIRADQAAELLLFDMPVPA